MNCDKCRELLSEYIDGRLGIEDASAVAAHIETCAGCRTLDRELRATIALMGDLEAKQAPPGFADSVTARLERRMLLDTPIEPEAPRRTLRPLPLAGMGLAAAAVILAAVFFLRTPSPTTVAPTAPLSSQAAPVTGTVAESAAQPADALRDAATGQTAGGAALDAEQRAKDTNMFAAVPAAPVLNEKQQLAKEAAPAAPRLGLEYDMKAAKPAAPAEDAVGSVAQTGAAESEMMTRQLKVEGETKAKALAETTARREVADKLSAPAAPAAATAPTAGPESHGIAIVAAQVPEQVVTVSSTDSAIAAAYALVAALPSVGSKPLPQGALSADLLRYAAFQRGAAVPEATDDRAVVEATLPSSTVAALRDRLTRGAAVSNEPILPKKSEEAAKGGIAGADSAGSVRVRFVFERVTPAAK